MKFFTLRFQDATQTEEISGMTAFAGEDASDSFGNKWPVLADLTHSPRYPLHLLLA